MDRQRDGNSIPEHPPDFIIHVTKKEKEKKAQIILTALDFLISSDGISISQSTVPCYKATHQNSAIGETTHQYSIAQREPALQASA